jgi:hypothetical protein
MKSVFAHHARAANEKVSHEIRLYLDDGRGLPEGRGVFSRPHRKFSIATLDVK